MQASDWPLHEDFKLFLFFFFLVVEQAFVDRFQILPVMRKESDKGTAVTPNMRNFHSG